MDIDHHWMEIFEWIVAQCFGELWVKLYFRASEIWSLDVLIIDRGNLNTSQFKTRLDQ
jgi:hypothetical protein